MIRRNFFQSLARSPLLKGSDKKADPLFLAAFWGLIVFGLVMLSSASAVVSYHKFNTSYYYVVHQMLYGLLPGAILFYIASKIDYRYWKKWAFALLVFSIVLLILVFIPGIGFEFGGARRWVEIGGIVFQPSELMKLAFLLYLATWMESKGSHTLKDFSYGFVPFLILVGIIAFLVISQPDMGTMGIIVLIAFGMYLVGGARLSHALLAVAGGAVALFALIKLAPYRLERFMTFLHPELDPLGVGYHINQALLAVGSGGWFGRGFGHSRQKFAYLPEVTGDSIFAVTAEELGFIVSVGIIGAFVFLAWRGLRIAVRSPDMYGTLIAVGIVVWVVSQAFVNIGAMLSLLPLTGIPLPFISYGGSSLVVLLTAMGILTNISRQTR